MAKTRNTILEVDGEQFPLKIHREYRRNIRVSLGKRAVNLRIPNALSQREEDKQIDWCREWVKGQFQKNDNLRQRFQGKGYKDGDILQVGSRTYQLHITYDAPKTHTARLKNSVISLRLNPDDDPFNLQKSIKHLLSRVIGKDFLSEISRRVYELNQLYFQKDIKSVRLKYNQTNWGSCSTQNNINLSTRLLFSPQEVIDYVIIHELAHLLEMNHSPKFWAIVENAMPDYKEKEKWLKLNGHLCDW